MKKIISTTYIMIILNLFLGSIKSQTVNYEYDNSGNIKSRKVITLKSSDATDSIVKSKIFEDTEINIKIYPNPTRGDLKIEIPDYTDNEILIFQVYDMSGRTLLNTKRNGALTTLDLSNFPNGTYILRMSRNGKASSWRIIKTN